MPLAKFEAPARVMLGLERMLAQASRCWALIFQCIHRRQQPSGDLPEPRFIGDFLPLHVGDVKDVDYLVQVGADLATETDKSSSEQRAGDRGQKARPVAGENVENRIAIRGAVVGAVLADGI